MHILQEIPATSWSSKFEILPATASSHQSGDNLFGPFLCHFPHQRSSEIILPNYYHPQEANSPLNLLPTTAVITTTAILVIYLVT